MLCNDCGKNNANVHLTKIINGKKTETHLCEDCAKKYATFNSTFSLQNIMTGFLTDTKLETTENIFCEKCGMSYDEFKEYGKFGCSKCYSSFKKRVAPFIRNIHGHDYHIGKIPAKAGIDLKNKKEIEKLKINLKESIELEEYEKAAELRDEIKRMEKIL